MATPPVVSPTYQTLTTILSIVSTVALATALAIPTVAAPEKTSSAVSPPQSSTLQERSTSRVSISPPPHKSSSGLSPPPPRRGGGEKGVSTSSSSSSLSTLIPVFVATAIVGIVLLLVFTIICFCCCNKKRRRRDYEPSNDYVCPPVPKSKDDSYGGQLQNLRHNPPASENHGVKFPPPPPHVALRSSTSSESIPLSKQCASPPPPPSINSSGGSGFNYSSSEHLLPPILPPSPGIVLGFGRSNFTYDELEIATNGFSDANLLGRGGFGYVHKGTLPNGKQVAVKQLKHGGGQGEREFHAEVEIISRVHHKHLVSLVGYCVTGGQRMLVYEFVPNNTLEFHLHGKDRPSMEWSLRNKIALGAAKGLAYLHEDCYPKIIHRDIKASNILIDFKFEAKVCDFGLAKFSSDSNTHVSTRVMGTFGYLAPEYASTGKLTEKSDVFSFGVVILELITGHRPINTSNSYAEDSLVDWARPLLTLSLQNNNFNDLVDPRLGKNYNTDEMIRMVSCAAACIRRTARHRPRMSQVVRALEGDVSLDVLNEDSMKAGHSNSPHESSDYDSGKYYDHMKKFRRSLMSGEIGSGEYSKTSEYGLYASASSNEEQRTDEFFEKRNKTQNKKSNS